MAVSTRSQSLRDGRLCGFVCMTRQGVYVRSGFMATDAWPNVQIEILARPEIIKTELAQRIRSLRGDRRREDFCRDLGVSKETFGNYERGDRVPDSAFLALLREKLGVDLNWLCTGETAREQGPAPLVRQTAAEADARLAEVREAFHREDFPLTAERMARLSRERSALEAIATALDLPDGLRAQADQLLRLVFQDADAAKRAADRERQASFESALARTRVDDAIAVAGWQPSELLRLALYQLSFLHQVTTESLVFLLHTMRQNGHADD